MFIKKNIKRLLNLIFFFDISLWLKCIKQIKKDKITKNSDFNWTMNIYDLYVLRKLIKKYNPKKILELGPGIGVSTEAIAEQMSEDCELIAVEHEEKCIKLAKERIKDLRKKVSILHSKVILSKEKIGLETICFENLGMKDFENIDLLVCDGPAWFIDEKKRLITDLPRGDLFNIFESLKVGCIIIIDGSAITRKIITRFCINSIRFLGIYGSWVFRIKKEPKLIDEKLKRLLNWNYLKLD
mgnify:CR=1 FL=1